MPGGAGESGVEPEIETYFEIEADLPPAGSDADPDLESELALNIALSGDLDLDEEQSVSITIEEEGHRVIETTTETSGHTLIVTVTEALAEERQRAITADDGAAVSGTISIPEDDDDPLAIPVQRRHRRHTET